MAELAGFDCSQWQAGAYSGGGGFSFGIVKLVEGVGYKDPAADRHMAAILAQPIIPGGYAFTRPDLNPGTAGAYAEADWFWSVASSYGGARGMLLVNDAESAGGSAQWCQDWAGRLAWRAGGYNPWLYSYLVWLQSRGIVGSALLAQDPLFFAWPDANGPLPLAVSMQQYGLTSVPGIVGQVDADRFFGDPDQLKELTVGGNTDMGLLPDERDWLHRALSIMADGPQSLADGTPVPTYPNLLGQTLMATIPALGAKLDALLKAEGVEQAALDALAANGAAASQVTSALAALADLKAAVAALPGGSQSEQPVLDAIAAVDKHVQATAAHLGVGTP